MPINAPAMQKMMVQKFFKYLNERQKIYERKEIQKMEPPWTTDRILMDNKFCNVFREDDRTTKWFRENVRDPLRDHPDVVKATIIFRWFNRISTGETLKEYLLEPSKWKTPIARAQLARQCPPYFTGAYIIRSRQGMSKLESVLQCIQYIPDDIHKKILYNNNREITISLENAWKEIKKIPMIGDFMAYEVVTDLRHTYVLGSATDVNTWANPGPGAARGINRILTRDPEGFYSKNSATDRVFMLKIMQALLQQAPEKLSFGKRFELREIEHGLCEFDKYMRVSSGEGRMKAKYDYSAYWRNER